MLLESDAIDIGSVVKTWRSKRGISRRSLAKQIGISPNSIRNWEEQRFAPRLPELEAALVVLEVPDSIRRTVILSLNRPRATQWLRRDLAGDTFAQSAGMPPSLPDLLHALRLRSGKTVEQIAFEVGISPRTEFRWENGDVWPDVHRLHRLCQALAATPEEIAALTQKQLIHQDYPLRFASLEKIDAAWTEFHTGPCTSRRVELSELTYLSLAAACWPLARHDPQAVARLFTLYAHLANHFHLQGVSSGAQRYSQRALQLAQGLKSRPANAGFALVRAAESETYPERGLNLLQRWSPELLSPGYHCWILSVRAELHRKRGDTVSAEADSIQSLRVGELADNADYQCRRWDRSDFLLKSGRYRDAEPFLFDPKHSQDPNVLAIWARFMAFQNRPDEALDFLRQARELAQERALIRYDLYSFYTRYIDQAHRDIFGRERLLIE